MSNSPAADAPAQADVLLVTATKIESLAVLNLFRAETGAHAEKRHIGNKTYYDLGRVAGNSVFLVQSEMGAVGLGAALTTVMRGIDALRPGAVIMVGIAFGVDADKQRIGDVLVAKQMFLYEPQRASTAGQGELEIRLRGDKASASPRLLDRLRAAELDWDLDRDTRELPRVHFGLVCTGEKLVDHRASRDQLLRWEPEAIGGEMEGAGLYVAATDSKVDWILVKAICDWADGNKNHQRKQEDQTLAANNAALFVLHAIRQGSLARPHDAHQSGAGSDGVQITNHASNQGAQGVFHGPITINNDNRRS
jgi:nucleoside phosphorylase